METSPLRQLLDDKKPEILALAEKYNLYNVRVFGSVARGEDTEDSDIDLLIDMDKGNGLFNWFEFWADVRELLERNVDVIPEKNLRWYLKKQVLSEARPL